MTTAHKKIGFKARALVSVLAVLGATMITTSAADAAPSAWNISTSDPTPGATGTTHTFTWNGYQTDTPARCIAVKYSNNPDGTGVPTGFAAGTDAPTGTFLTGTYTRDAANADTTGQFVFNNASATAVTAGPRTITWSLGTEPTAAAGQSVYVTVTTYDTAGSGSSGTCNGSALETVVASYATNPQTVVTAVVDGTLTFTVAGAADCNGVTNSAGATSGAAAVSLGSLSGSEVRFAAQSLLLTSNAGNGFNVYMKSTKSTANEIFSDAANHHIADATGDYADQDPIAAGTPAFGYTAAGTGVSFTSGEYARVPTSAENDTVLTGSANTTNGSGCVGYGAAISSTTPAGAYSTNIIYRAVPSY